MALIDTYRSNITRKKSEISKLSQDKAKESAKIPALKSKIIAAKSAIERTKIQSTIKSKLSDIGRAEKDIAAVNKKIADYEKKIAQKDKELASEQKKYDSEVSKQDQKKASEEKKRIKENERVLSDINIAISRQSYIQDQIKNEIIEMKKVPEKITVLFMASNPINTNHLRLDEEARSIQEMIRKSEHRDSVNFETRWAARPLDILQAINELNPAVIHFSGHGAETGELVLENSDGTAKLVRKEAIVQTIMTSTDNIRLVFFNACFSEQQAEAVVENVDVAIGMNTSIGDKAAVVFASQFYSAISFGLSIKIAFEQAKAALMLENIPEENTPQLFVRDGLNASDIFLVLKN